MWLFSSAHSTIACSARQMGRTLASLTPAAPEWCASSNAWHSSAFDAAPIPPLHPPLGDRARATRSRRLHFQGRDAAFQKAIPPARRLLGSRFHPLRDLPVLQAVRRQQHNLRPLPQLERA
jgi:hypothetical protein